MYSNDDFVSLDGQSIDWDDILGQKGDDEFVATGDPEKNNDAGNKTGARLFTTLYTKDIFECRFSLCLQQAQEDLVEDKIMALTNTGRKIIAILGKIQCDRKPGFLLDMIYSTLTAGDHKKLPSSRLEDMWRAFSIARSEPEFIALGVQFLRDQCLVEGSDLTLKQAFSSLVRQLFNVTLNDRNRFDSKPFKESKQEKELSEVESQALYYIGGALCTRLEKKCRGLSSDTTQYLELVTSFCGDSPDTELPFEWTDAVNRGGLLYITRDFFAFLKALDNIISRHFNNGQLINYHAGGLGKEVLNDVYTSEVCLKFWDILCSESFASDTVKEKVLDMVVKFFVTIRGHSFSRQVVECAKIKMRQKSLRATLKD